MRLVFDSNESKRLFLSYAIPCADVLVRRKKISKDKLNKLKSDLIQGKDINGVEKIFVVASSMCYIISRKMKKKRIDKKLIRKYFWHEHKKAIDWRYNFYKDFNPVFCKVYPGKVIIKKRKTAVVLTPIGKLKLKTDFIPGLLVNDLVTVHYDYIVEKITNRQFKSLWNKYK